MLDKEDGYYKDNQTKDSEQETYEGLPPSSTDEDEMVIIIDDDDDDSTD